MKHHLKITLILIALFVLSQLVGLAVLTAYQNSNTLASIEEQGTSSSSNTFSIIIGFVIAIALFAFFMKVKATLIIKIWFTLVTAIALWITFFSITQNTTNGAILAGILVIPLIYYKIIKRNIIIHNLSEILIYPGIAILFIPLLSTLSIILLLIVISIYDIYAVWHAKFMQKMALYQMQKVKVFSGLLIPYKLKKSNKSNKVSLAILGGGDIVFPIIASGIIMVSYGFIPALIVILGSTLGLLSLFIISEKGKFYPAMPFITAGCLLGILLATLL